MRYSTENVQALGKGSLIPAGGLIDKELLSRLQGYRRLVAGSYRSLLPEDITTRITAELMHASPKIDGEIWFLVIGEGDAFLSNTVGKLIIGDIPLLKEAKKALPKLSDLTVIAGELFAARKEGRPRVGDVSAALSGGVDAAVEKLGFAAFDILCGGDQEATLPLENYSDKLALMQRILKEGKRVKVVTTENVNTPDQVANLFKKWVEDGKAEGVVVRTPNRICKIKPSFNIDAVIIGYTERTENPNQIRSLALALMRSGGQFQYVSACGNMNTETRESMMALIKDDVVASNWRLTRGDGALFRFVKPKHVVEIKATDVVDQDNTGEPVRQMVLAYTDKEGWQAVRKRPAPSLLFPVFLRIRQDKQMNETDVRLSQVLDRCFVPDLDKNVKTIELPKSEVRRREVYTKTSKKGMAVRKLVVWKTNKENVDERFPEYVVQFTDYSPGRKDPLKREVRRAQSSSTADSIAAMMIEKNVKKGWVKKE